jgi:hypothetical protein
VEQSSTAAAIRLRCHFQSEPAGRYSHEIRIVNGELDRKGNESSDQNRPKSMKESSFERVLQCYHIAFVHPEHIFVNG